MSVGLSLALEQPHWRTDSQDLLPETQCISVPSGVKALIILSMINRLKVALPLALLLSIPSFSQTPDPHSVPSVDAGIGSCTADFTVTDTDNKPVYAAKVKVHIAYGFGGFHKLDLEVGTNADGKARFTGLPNRLKKGGLFFQASESERTGDAFDDPSKTCQAQFPVTLRKPLTPPNPQ